MPSARRSVWSPALVVAYLVVGAALYANRLFSVLHAESSAVVAFFAFLFSGLHLLSYARYELPGVRLLGAHLAMLAIPWVLLTLSLFWVPNCAYLTGLVLYLVFTIPSVVLALGVGVVVHAFVPRFRRTLYVVIAILLALIGTVYDLALHPQFYVLNHVYGGVLGPIYEEALYVRPGLFAFRALTILWAVVLLTLSAARGGFQGADALTTRARRALLGMAGLGIGLIYLFVWQVARGIATHLGIHAQRRRRRGTKVVLVRSESQAGLDFTVTDATEWLCVVTTGLLAIGVGETPDDIEPFDPEVFIDAMFAVEGS